MNTAQAVFFVVFNIKYLFVGGIVFFCDLQIVRLYAIIIKGEETWKGLELIA